MADSEQTSFRLDVSIKKELTLKAIEFNIDFSELMRRYIVDGLRSNRMLETEIASVTSMLNAKKEEYESFKNKCNSVYNKFEAEIQTLQTSLDLLNNKLEQSKNEEKEIDDTINNLKEKLLSVSDKAGNQSKEFAVTQNLKLINSLDIPEDKKQKIIEKLRKSNVNYLRQ